MDSEAHEAQGDFYTVDEAAKVLGRTPGRIHQLLRDGTLEGVRVAAILKTPGAFM